MVMDGVLGRFIEQCPVAVMARLGLERTLSDAWVNEVFEKNRRLQYTGELHFSTVVDLMGLVATGQRPSLNAAVQKYSKELPVSQVSLYAKVNHTEPAVVRALVSGSAERLTPVMSALNESRAALLEGYRLRVFDGNHLPASEKRLECLRDFRGASLPGHSLVVYDPDADLVIDVVPCEDAHQQERTLLGAILGKSKPGELWIGDRNMCTAGSIAMVEANKSTFLFREHGANPNPAIAGPLRKIERTETGTVYEQPVLVTIEDGHQLCLRRIELVLDCPTEDGDTIIRLLTNLPAEISALKIAELYRRRWSIEGMFCRLEAALNSEIRTMGYPRAALLAFGCAIVAYNVLALIEAAIAAAHDLPAMGIELSTYQIADEVKYGYAGMMIAVLTTSWKQFDIEDPVALAKTLRQIAAHVNPRAFRKHRRGPKEKKKKGYAPRASIQKQVATARVLRDGGIK